MSKKNEVKKGLYYDVRIDTMIYITSPNEKIPKSMPTPLEVIAENSCNKEEYKVFAFIDNDIFYETYSGFDPVFYENYVFIGEV